MGSKEVFTFDEDATRRIAREVFKHEREAMLQHLHRSLPRFAGQEKQHVRFRNGSGEAIPPRAVMRVSGVERRLDRTNFIVAKPDNTYSPLYLVNGRLAVSSGSKSYGFGSYLTDRPGKVLADLTTGTPSQGYRWGPTSGSWKIICGNQGFSIRFATTGVTPTYSNAYVWATQDVIRNKTTAFVNDSGETVPAFGIMKMQNDFDNTGRMRITKPDTSFQRMYLVNNSFAVPDGEGGHGTFLKEPSNDLGRALFSESPTMMTEYGAKPGEWELYPNRPGFMVQGNPVDVGGGLYSARTHQREVTRVKGYLVDGEITTLGSGSFKVYSGMVDEAVDAGFTALTCWHWGCEDILNAGQDLKGWCVWQDSQWIFNEACCPSGIEES